MAQAGDEVVRVAREQRTCLLRAVQLRIDLRRGGDGNRPAFLGWRGRLPGRRRDAAGTRKRGHFQRLRGMARCCLTGGRGIPPHRPAAPKPAALSRIATPRPTRSASLPGRSLLFLARIPVASRRSRPDGPCTYRLLYRGRRSSATPPAWETPATRAAASAPGVPVTGPLPVARFPTRAGLYGRRDARPTCETRAETPAPPVNDGQRRPCSRQDYTPPGRISAGLPRMMPGPRLPSESRIFVSSSTLTSTS